MSERSIGVVIVSWNTRELLRRCLISIEATRGEAVRSVCVVDNGSADGSAEMVRTEFGWVDLVQPSQNLGFGAAANAGAARLQATWLAIANADTELTPDALQTLQAAVAHHPGVGIIAPRLVLPDGSTQHSVYAFPGIRFTLAFNLGLGAVSRRLGDRLALEGRWNPERPRQVDWAIGAFLLIRRETWDAIGGYDERQWMYAEDLDLGWRAAQAGWATRYEPRAVVLHVAGASTAQGLGPNPTDRWLRSTYAWLWRRRGPLAMRTIALANLLGAVARLAWVSLPASMLRGRWVARWRAERRWTRLHLENLVAPGRVLREHR